MCPVQHYHSSGMRNERFMDAMTVYEVADDRTVPKYSGK